MKKMSGSGYDYVIIDTAPGISLLGPPEYIDEALIITTPDMTSCTSSMKLAKTLDKHKITHALLVNRAKNKRFEISKREIDELYGKISYGPVPEDEDVQESIAQHIPTLIKYGRSPFSKSIQAISYMYLAKKGRAVSEQSKGLTTGGGLIGFLKRVIGLS